MMSWWGPRPPSPWVPIAVLALGTWATAATAMGFFEGRAREEADREVRALRTQILEEKANALGWETKLVEATEDLTRRLQEEEDSALAGLARELEAADAELVSVTKLLAVARGQIEARATVHVADVDSVGSQLPDSITAPIDDGILKGRVAYFPVLSLFDLAYQVTIPGELVESIAPDGRLMVAARSSDPRAELLIPSVRYQMPEPVEYCSLWTRAKWGIGGAGGGALLSLTRR